MNGIYLSQPRVPKDPLGPARGCVVSLLIAVVMWSLLVGGIILFTRSCNSSPTTQYYEKTLGNE